MHLQALLQAYLVAGRQASLAPCCPWSLTEKQLLMGNFDDLKVIQFILLDFTGINACLTVRLENTFKKSGGIYQNATVVV